MPTLVTGATGFLGGHLVPLLVERGHRVRALVRQGTPDEELRALGVEIARGDVREPGAVRAAARDCELVYHLAGLVSHERSDGERLRAINVEGTRAVVAALEAGARLVHVSSISAFGPARSRDDRVDETTPFPQAAEGYPYAASKRAAEELVLAAGVDAVIANPGFLLGPGDRYGVSTWPVHRYLDGRLRFTSRGGLSYCDARDVATGLVLVAERGRSGERYLLTSEAGNLAYTEFFPLVGEVAGVRRRMLHVPPWLAIATATVLRWPVAPGEARAGTNWWFATPAKAERELGFTTRPIEETIAATAADRPS